MLDVLIKNGIVFDGTGQGHGVRRDIGVQNGAIVSLGDTPRANAHEVIDAEGLYVAPGFIDIQNHSDSHGLILNKPGLESMVAQGVTTICVGQCGASLAPLPVLSSIKSLQKWGGFEGINADWRSFAEFRDRLGPNLFGANIASFVGHGTLRRAFTGDSARELTPDEINQLALILRQALNEGAFGVSFGFQYGHEIKTSVAEVLALLSVAKEFESIFSLHLRSQDESLLQSISDVLEIARAVGVKTKISHLKVEGLKNKHQLDQGLRLIENEYQAGTPIRFDVYPYTTTWRSLYTYLPSWAYEGGFQPMLERMKQKSGKMRILTQLGENRRHLADLLVTTSPKVYGFVGKTVAQISHGQGLTPEQAVLNILSANHGQTVVFDHNVDPGQVTSLLKHPLSFVASDGVGYPFNEPLESELPHPRCFGTFPRFLRMLRNDNDETNTLPLLSWAEGLAKITGWPAQFLGLSNRGFIRKNYRADIVVFDPDNISDLATYTNPFKAPQGVRYVLNNGKISLFEGQLTGVYGGRLLKTASAA